MQWSMSILLHLKSVIPCPKLINQAFIQKKLTGWGKSHKNWGGGGKPDIRVLRHLGSLGNCCFRLSDIASGAFLGTEVSVLELGFL